ncbi:MAG: hypothetical protein ACHQNE_07130 [Candidatus Kapaibacterium sp.]
MLLLTSVSTLIFIPSLHAQASRTGILLGAAGGYQGVVYNTNAFSVPLSKPGFFVVQSGSAGTQFFGLTAEIPLSSGMDDFLVLEGIYDSRSGDFASMTRVNSGDSSMWLSTSLAYALLNIGFKYNMVSHGLPSMFGLKVCASFGLAVHDEFFMHQDSVAANQGYPGYSVVKSQTIASEIDGLNEFRIAIRAELTYDIPVGTRWIFTPYVGFDTPLTKVDNTDRNWTTRSVYAALALLYRIGGDD